ncbi:bifunctional 5,10-methylenetetrahydrofolate dehydrogenase/5,10-methenyltetrahydrofolate cyclohydrolase [Candidatus Nomurabacteria bacterium]|nr:bifunctional 5,10-methylenetetrahydrofolate dehydrogenase/5,10-methenyltetrahydrofolate cyclohydrolase [Candidatus Nomurabacteria bacterium]
MLVDGKAIAADIYQEIRNIISHTGERPHLTVFTCAPNFETQKYLNLKRKKAAEVGIATNVIEFPADITTEEVIASINHATIQTDGVIVQLPFPAAVDTDRVLQVVPVSLDVDALRYVDAEHHTVLPPVVGAIDEIAQRYAVSLLGRNVVVVGQGRLVGKPAAKWATALGANVTVIDKDTDAPEVLFKEADIIISGAGKAGLIKPEMVKDGVIIFDAGTSEEGGELRGDVDPSCADKARLFTPVPGGIGPITVAVLLRNLVQH